MKMLQVVLATALIVSVSSLAIQSRDAVSYTTAAPMLTLKQKVVNVLKAIQTGDVNAFNVISPTMYKQHNLGIPDGLSGILSLLPTLNGSATANTVRVFQDGNVVFAHSDYNFFGPKIGFDTFRFENGLVVEHWDNLQTTAGPNPSGHSMIDGPTQSQDLDKTDANKVLARAFVDDIFVNRRVEKVAQYLNGDNFIQHDPLLKDGAAALKAAFAPVTMVTNTTVVYNTIQQVFGEGNFVLVTSQGTIGSQSMGLYDLIRVENGKIAEHWNVVQAIPDRSQWANNNGKF